MAGRIQDTVLSQKINVVLHIIDKGYYEKVILCVFSGALYYLLSNQQIFATNKS